MRPQEYGYWIGFRRPRPDDIPPGWHLCRLQELATFSAGGRLGLTMSDYSASGFDAYSAEGLNGKAAIAEFDGPAVIVSSIGARCGKCFLARGKFTTLANVQVVFPDPKRLDPTFLWNLVNDERFWPRYATAQPFIRPSDIKESWVPVPPADEQAAIAHILDAVDTALERTRAAVERAREVKRALVQRVFSEGTRGEASRKTAIGHLPRSWEVVSVNSVVAAFQYGLSVPMAPKGELPVLRMGNIQDGDVLLSDLKFVSLPARDVAPYHLRRGDVLFNRTNSQEWVGKVGIYRHDTPAVFASYLIRLIPDAARVDGYYLGHVLGSYPSQCRIKKYATPGVQQVNINATNLGKVLIPLPVGDDGLREQRVIAAMLEAADAAVRSREPVLVAQQALKESLMHDLLTGRVRVRNTSKVAAS